MKGLGSGLTADAGLAALAAAGRRLRNSGHCDVVGFEIGAGFGEVEE